MLARWEQRWWLDAVFWAVGECLVLSYLLRRQGQPGKYGKRSWYQAGTWAGACVKCHLNDRVPLVPQFPLPGTLVLARAVSIRGEQTVLHSGMSAASEDEQQRPHRYSRAGLVKEVQWELPKWVLHQALDASETRTWCIGSLPGGMPA